VRRERGGDLAHAPDRVRLAVDAIAVEAVPQEVDQIAAVTASGIEHAAARVESASQDLVEQVDVDVAELQAELGADRVLGVLGVHWVQTFFFRGFRGSGVLGFRGSGVQGFRGSEGSCGFRNSFTEHHRCGSQIRNPEPPNPVEPTEPPEQDL
jgi:hypothetical protein